MILIFNNKNVNDKKRNQDLCRTAKHTDDFALKKIISFREIFKFFTKNERID